MRVGYAHAFVTRVSSACTGNSVPVLRAAKGLGITQVMRVGLRWVVAGWFTDRTGKGRSGRVFVSRLSLAADDPVRGFW